VKLKSAHTHTALNTGNSHIWSAGWVAEASVNKAREHKYFDRYERPTQSPENSIAKKEQEACKIANV